MSRKLSGKIFILISCLFIVVALLIGALISNLYKLDINHIKELSDKDFKEGFRVSGYILTAEQNGKSLGIIKNSNGEIFYLNKDYEKRIRIYIYIILILCLCFLVVYYLMRYYNKKKIQAAVEPVEKMAKVITDILSGGSSESNLEEVYDKIHPLLLDEGVNKKELEESIKNLIESEQRRREFTANVTHELKTPLTSINGYAEMIASGHAEEEDIKKFSNIILNEGNRLLKLINEILTLSKYDNAGRDTMSYEKINLTKLTKKLISEMEAYAKAKEINLEFLGDKVFILADKKMMEEMITNLVSNAIKYNYPGGNVHVNIVDKADDARIIVRDDGIGISKADCERIFERFYMVNRSGKESSGTGLGLSLVKHIVKSHDGNIKVKSKPGRGSTFTIDIPKGIKQNQKNDEE